MRCPRQPCAVLSRRTEEAHEPRRGRSGACTHLLLRPVQDSVRHPALANSYRRLLPKSRPPAADEPPAEEANQSTDNSYHSHRDACYGAGGEAGTTITSSAIPHEQQRTASAAGGSQLLAYISTHLCAGSASSTAGQRCTRTHRSTLGWPRRYVCIHMHKHMEQQLGRDRSAGSVARRHSAPRGVHRGHRAAPHCVEVGDQVALGAQDTDRTLSKDQLSQGCASGDS